MISTALQSQNLAYTEICIVQPAKILQTFLAYIIKSAHKKRSQPFPNTINIRSRPPSPLSSHIYLINLQFDLEVVRTGHIPHCGNFFFINMDKMTIFRSSNISLCTRRTAAISFISISGRNRFTIKRGIGTKFLAKVYDFWPFGSIIAH